VHTHDASKHHALNSAHFHAPPRHPLLLAFPPLPLPAPRWVASSAGGARFNFDDKKSGFLTGVDSGVTAMRGAAGW